MKHVKTQNKTVQTIKAEKEDTNKEKNFINKLNEGKKEK